MVAAPPPRPHSNSDVNPFDEKVAIRTLCPKCGDTDWFEWRLFGKLTDPVCGYTWYVATGTYTGRQLRASFDSAKRWTKHMSSGGSGADAMIGRIFGLIYGSMVGLIFRLPFGLLMIPIQAAVRAAALRAKTSEAATKPPQHSKGASA